MWLLVLTSARASAQWVVHAAAGGTEHDAIAADVGTRSAILGVRYEGAEWLSLSGGVPLDSVGLPWAAAGAGGRWSAAGSALQPGIEAFGLAYGFREPTLAVNGSGGIFSLLPFVGWQAATTRVEVRGGLLGYGSSFGTATETRILGEGGLRIVTSASPGLYLQADLRNLVAEEGSYPFAGASAHWSLGAASLHARAGRWFSDDLDDFGWDVGGRLWLDGRTGVYAALEQEATDPLYWNEPRRRWTIGMSRSLGGRIAPVAPVAAPVVPLSDAGLVEIEIPHSAAETPPRIAGDFNDWKPVEMRREGDSWAIELRLEPGVYRYAFVGADGNWFVPPSIPNQVDDGFGGKNAVLVVTAGGPQ